MKGGYQIIDLRKIGLELKSTQQTISDTEILKQLRGLRDYIEKSHDYTKALNNSLKPILIRYRDAKNNEKKEVTSFASIVNENSSLTFTIIAKHLEIEVVFEEKTDDDGNKYYDIKTAKYLYSLDETVEGDLIVEGDTNLKGDVDIDGDVGIDGDASVGGDLLVTGSINGEEHPSVKPIYCHPIAIFDVTNADTTKRFMLTCLIFNNSNTPFTKETFEQFVQDIQPSGGGYGRIMISGGYNKLILSSLTWKTATQKLLIEGWDYSTNDYDNKEIDLSSSSITFNDGVNKIN